MSVTLQNQTVTCNQYQFMVIDPVAGKAYPIQAYSYATNPGVLAASNSSVAAGSNVVCNLPEDDSAGLLITVVYETGNSAVTSSPRWVGASANGKAIDLGAAYQVNSITKQLGFTPRPRAAYGVSRGAGTPGSSVKVELFPY